MNFQSSNQLIAKISQLSPGFEWAYFCWRQKSHQPMGRIGLDDGQLVFTVGKTALTAVSSILHAAINASFPLAMSRHQKGHKDTKKLANLASCLGAIACPPKEDGLK